ncbi:MAG TPA: SDR family NAD(P)-dependent oxidoreductase [Rudaea sp.]|nr:SDR family NAD(P)-dependent oxidoreductase [Rudaea sp.]
MNLDLRGKHALVCGGSQGIGRAAAIELAQLGADVTVLARSAQALQSVVAALPKTHPVQSHSCIVADANDHDGMRAALENLVQTRPVQILINNSGGPPGGPAHSAKVEDYVSTFRQHLGASQIALQAVLPGMRAAGFGRVVNVISTSVKEPIENLGVSNTVRAAVAAWAKTCSRELAPFGITVNNVLPGFTKTQRLTSLIAAKAKASGKSEDAIAQEMLAAVPAARFADAAELASVVAFLCTPAAAYVNGVSIAVDGGRTHALS